MIEEIFTTLSSALNSHFGFAILAATGWGIISVLLSPCHLTSIPLVIGYISTQNQSSVKKSFNLSLIFAVGILFTIALIGIITAFLGRILGDVGKYGNWFVATIFIIVGFYLLDIVKLNWAGFSLQNSFKRGMLGALILGLLFGIGLGPCTFAFLAPVLGVVFQIGGSNLLKAILLIAAFGVGHCVVIVVAGSVTQAVQNYLNWTNQSKSVSIIRKIAGVFVILGGIYFFMTSY